MTASFGRAAPMARTVADIDLPDLAARRISGMRKVASTGGGEWKGPCPNCGGTDRFVVNGEGREGGGGLYWCRQCGVTGDAVALIQLLDGCDPGTAFRTLGIGRSIGEWKRDIPALPSTPVEPVEPPPPLWRTRALQIVIEAEHHLWGDAGEKARAYLHGRGLTDDTIKAGHIGYIPFDQSELRADWGLDDAKRAYSAERLTIQRGLLMPYLVQGEFWRLEVRRPVTPDSWCAAPGQRLPAFGGSATGRVWQVLKTTPYVTPAQLARACALSLQEVQSELEWLAAQLPSLVTHPAKYVTVAGSSNSIWGHDTWIPGRPGVLVEGVLNGLSIQQVAGDLVNVAALGATTHGRRAKWLLALGRWAGQLIALDADAEANKGDRASDWWIDALQPTAVRWRPQRNDCNAMLVAGDDLRAWVAEGVATISSLRPASTHTQPVPAKACPTCGQALYGAAEVCSDCATKAPVWRGLDGLEEHSDAAVIARVEAERTEPEGPPSARANWKASQDGWWDEFTWQLDEAPKDIQEAVGDWLDARRNHNKELQRELMEALKDSPVGRGIMRAYMEWDASCRMTKLVTKGVA